VFWCGPPNVANRPVVPSKDNVTPFSSVLTAVPAAPQEIQHAFTPCAACVLRQSRRTTRDAPRLSADLPAIAPILRRLRFLLASNHLLLLSTIANSPFSITVSIPSSNIAFSFEKESVQPRALPSETPDRCREGLTSELSLLGPVSSSVDLTSSQETHTLSDSPAPSQAPSYTIPHSQRHPSPTTAPSARSKLLQAPGDLTSTHLHRTVATPSTRPHSTLSFTAPAVHKVANNRDQLNKSQLPV
jgi:hypothetical protein